MFATSGLLPVRPLWRAVLLRTLAVVLLLMIVRLLLGHAFAQAAVASKAPSDSFDLGSLIVFCAPYFGAIVGPIISFYAFLAVKRVATLLGVTLTQSQWAIVHSAAMAAAQRLWANSEPAIATARINLGSPGIAAAAQAAVDDIKGEVTRTGITPDEMSKLVVAKLGAMQAAAPAAAPVAAIVPAPAAAVN